MPVLHTEDPTLLDVLRMAERAADSTANVLITGESGTGKNRLARHVHEQSRRSSGPFVEVACANLPHELLESELFGHERGAFTGAHQDRAGRFEQAHGGTLFLDEIAELAPELQAKVLRAIEEKRFERLGGQRTRDVDVRIVAATREDPERLVAAGRFRDDLYYRLNVVHLRLPPLRARGADIRLLAVRFLTEARAQHRVEVQRFDDEVLSRFSSYPWPGNVRELWHVVQSAAIMARSNTVMLSDLPAELSLSTSAMLGTAADREVTLAELERAYIAEVLDRTGGNKSAAARILGIHRKTLHEKLRDVD